MDFKSTLKVGDVVIKEEGSYKGMICEVRFVDEFGRIYVHHPNMFVWQEDLSWNPSNFRKLTKLEKALA
jgi:hypothetical protein